MTSCITTACRVCVEVNASGTLLPFSLQESPALPALSCIDVGPQGFADWVKEKGAATRTPRVDVPMCTLLYDPPLYFPAIVPGPDVERAAPRPDALDVSRRCGKGVGTTIDPRGDCKNEATAGYASGASRTWNTSLVDDRTNTGLTALVHRAPHL
eukprot:4567955-Pyramimonas_sp.AAC.1